MKFVPTSELERQAIGLLHDVAALRVPIPVDVVAHRLGLVVDEVPLGDDISGVLVVQNGRGVVGINSEHPLVRKRFTLAHEIAHFVLHRADSELFIDRSYAAFRNNRSESGDSRGEIQANQFAAALLMPEDLVREELGADEIDLGDADVLNQLAERFVVSSQAMAFRIANLGWLAAK